MTTPLTFENKAPAEIYRNELDWGPLLLGATISAVTAEVIEGDVDIDLPYPTSFSGAIQTVWITGGTEGRQLVRMTATMSDGRRFIEDMRFRVRD